MDEQEQSGWVDITDELDEQEVDPLVQSIELDCAPTMPRPGNWIGYVLKDTGLVAEEPVLKFFGNWRYEWRMEREQWEREIVPIVKPRIIALYERGLIRFGSW